jgi:glycosyltransferase involved in cell wall biosynthesis
MKIWLPALRVGTGTDVFTLRLAEALGARGVDAQITWFPAWMEAFPELMRLQRPPAGINLVHGNGWTVAPFLGHHLVHDPAFSPYRSAAQALYHRWHLRWREERAIRQSAAVTAVSDYVAGTVRDFAGRDDVKTISNWVDVERYHPAETPPRQSGERLRVLWVGNPSRRKGFDLLPGLLARLEGFPFEVRCVGGLRGDAVAPAVDGRVTWLGRLQEDELIAEYQSCDVLLSLSRYEGFGYTALEAMACGKPVVGFAAGGISEVVRHGEAGLLSPVDDLDGLAAHMRSLASPERRAALGARGLQLARAQPAQVDAYIALYSSLVGA